MSTRPQNDPEGAPPGESARARKHFLLRLEPTLHAELEGWAQQEMRSLNAQIEWLLREAVRRRGRDRSSEPS